ncbi:MAG TPA: phosphoribosylanthranilate isomerase [Leptolyngbyaceae cyanobacterium M65_K2018_010]|nr:phosphoribosylanthranilate isomerase [Leptolyngbyaceae cyanobacterium M65_K2018_010]
MRVKICGLTEVDQALAIAQLGATDLGFICVPQSPRYRPPSQIASMVAALKAEAPAVGTVGVFADADPATIQAVVTQTGLSTLQLHGAEPVEQCQLLRALLPSTRLIKAIRVRTREDLQRALGYGPQVDALLLDAYHPEQLGGTGLTLDWSSLARFSPPCPWLLAGGLRPDNVQQALTVLSPDGIDLSSGVEQQPGLKDLHLVRQLFEQLRPWLRIPVS